MPRKKTHEEFLEDVKALVGDEYEVIGKYINAVTKISMKHNVCGYEYDVRPSNFVNIGNRCPRCGGSMKKTTEMFKKEIFKLVGNEYSVLEDYVDAKTNTKIIHNACRYEYSVAPDSFLRGNRCPNCSNNKKNTERFKKEVFNLVGDEYIVLSDYEKSKIKIKMKHIACSSEYEVTPSNFLTGTRCPQCVDRKKKSTEQYKKDVINLVGDEYEVIGEYVDNKKKINMMHKTCGHSYEVRPTNFLSGRRCPKCNNHYTMTNEEFIEKIRVKYKDIIVLGKIEKMKNKVLFKHNNSKCGFYEWFALPINVLRGHGCPKCAGIIKKTTEQYKKEVFKLVDNEYEVLGEYINANKKIKMKHVRCGSLYGVTPSSFLMGTRCPQCAKRVRGLKTRKTPESFRKRFEAVSGEEYSLITEYTASHNKVKVRHNNEKCDNYEYLVSPAHFLTGTRCPKCNDSKGEKKIYEYMIDNDINFIEQHRFTDCKNKKPLPFDFAIVNNDDTINCLIEFDGKQHFEPVSLFGGEKGFKKRQHNDQIKNQYCKDNNIKLIRIPYWDFDNIEDILNEELKDLINQSKSESNV